MEKGKAVHCMALSFFGCGLSAAGAPHGAFAPVAGKPATGKGGYEKTVS